LKEQELLHIIQESWQRFFCRVCFAKKEAQEKLLLHAERILEDDGKFKNKSLNLEIFVEFYFEINFIVGQRPLFYEGERNEVKRKRSIPLS
jgi:hypothetical protein